MEGFAVAHRDSMAAMAEKNSEALAAVVGKIAETLTSCVGHPSQDVPSPGLSLTDKWPSLWMPLVTSSGGNNMY